MPLAICRVLSIHEHKVDPPVMHHYTDSFWEKLAQDSLSHGKGGHSHVLAHVGSQAQHHQPAWALVLTECVELCLDLYCTIIGWTCIIAAPAQKHSSGTAEQRWVWGDQLNSEKAVMSYKCVICGKTTMMTVSAA